MKLPAHQNKLETNVEEAVSQDFTISEAGVIIEILRNRLYQHKIQTSCQEIISNSRDAAREIGKLDSAMEITVPTELSPVFKCRDFGPGISPDRMANVFVRYGSSTKRHTNELTGGLGIGAKSFFSYADSFTITTFIDGTKRCYIAHIGVNNQGRLDLIGTEPTTEENGTEIQVAAKRDDIEEFRQAIFRATYFWKDKPVLKGELNPPTLTHGYMIGATLEVIEGHNLPDYFGLSHYGDDALAVIDGIPYLIPHTLISKVKPLENLSKLCRRRVVLHFGNGLVEVAASRESIADSEHTLEALKKICGKALVEAQTHISDMFGKASSKNEYLNTYKDLSYYFNVDKFAKYDGYTIENGYIKSDLFKDVRMVLAHRRNRRGRGRIDKITKAELIDNQKRININQLENLFHVDSDESSVKRGKRIKEYLETHDEMLIMEGLSPSSLDQLTLDLGSKGLSTIKLVEVPKEQKAKIVREKTQICLHTLEGYDRYTHTTLGDNKQKWLYVNIESDFWTNTSVGNLKEFASYLSNELGVSLCGVSTRAEKMIKGDVNFSPLSDWLDSYKPSQADINLGKVVHNKNGSFVDTLKQVKDIKDPFLAQMVQEYRDFVANFTRKMPTVLLQKIVKSDEMVQFTQRDEAFTAKMDNEYPLVKSLNSYPDYNEVAFYINAKYNKGVKKNV